MSLAKPLFSCDSAIDLVSTAILYSVTYALCMPQVQQYGLWLLCFADKAEFPFFLT